MIETAFEQFDDQAGSQFLRSVGQRLIVLMPDFDRRKHDCVKRVTLSEKMDTFDVGQDGSRSPQPLP
ncbi:hypothetical protein [Sphingomonas abaci]|uniref:Uncharacterized protein n=1 Tax=Sphingomonas abaci TaxID=237611 RepID=A0A7W7APH5_9SPHN|nr:hypothetical protein [Sphingomonas abaci]MBB4619767.1 hypothetical protein [Sphingomonas abaci]